jgi:hypothetical protein
LPETPFFERLELLIQRKDIPLKSQYDLIVNATSAIGANQRKAIFLKISIGC